MIHAFEPLRTITNGEYPGADTYWNALAARSHWLYGQAHALNFPFAQRWGSGIVNPIWEGETPVRPEHMTLKFSARVNLTGPAGVARLQYYAVGGWTNLATDTNTTGLRFFGGTTEVTVHLTGLTPADGIWTFRLILTGNGGWGIVYRAYLTGTTGFTAWPGTLPTFTTGAPTTAANLDKLRQMQEYLFGCACQPRVSGLMGTVRHGQGASDETVYRWAFQYTGTQRLYYYLTISGLTGSGGHVRLYLIPDTYNADAGDSRIATLVDEITDGTKSGNVDLSTKGLTVGTGYGLELVAYDGATVAVGHMGLDDLGGVTRTYVPKDDWAHGDTPTKAVLDTFTNDLNQMYPASDRESPIFSQHVLSTWQGPGTVGLFDYTAFRFRGVRRWRYLRYRGAGRLVSADGTVTVSLSDTDPPGGPQVLDLESVAVPYGMEYYVESYGSGVIIVAYEDYA